MHKAQSFAATGVQWTARPTVERLVGRVTLRAVVLSGELKQDF
jgi:hypothetical protein